MQPIHEPANQTAELDPPPQPAPDRVQRRLIISLILLLLILVLTFIPPLLNVNRFQQRIASNISAALGRPVHFKNVSLSLLPLPGFTLETFVVEEDPAFGSEPILRADNVRATVRLTSLFSSHVEFSKISFTDPSVNLVHTANGQWNLQSILLHASHIQAAPTGQRSSGPAPRFPYIEATGARLNLKLDQEKTPYSLTDADFALWLPEPRQWHFRLEAHPVRTDIAPAETGTLRLEGTLGNPDTRAATLAGVPIDLTGNVQDAQIVGLSRLLLGRDAGLRGDLNADIHILGNLGHAAIATHIQLAHGRRADFVPPTPLSVEASCQAVAQDTFHAFSSIECHWPPTDSSNPSVLILAAAVPDTRRPNASTADFTLPALPASTFLDWLRVATPHPPTGLTGPGTLAGTLAWRPAEIATSTEARSAQRRNPQLSPQPVWSGELEFSGESLQTPALGPDPIPLGEILLRSTPQTAAGSFDLLPITLSLGGKQPATLEGHFDATGYTLHLTGPAIPIRLLALADAIPQFGDGLRPLLDPKPDEASTEAAHATPTLIPSQTRNSPAAPAPEAETNDPPAAPIHYDLTATRTWGGPQTWREAQPTTPQKHRR